MCTSIVSIALLGSSKNVLSVPVRASVMNELEHICLRVVLASQPGLVCDVSVALFDAGRVAGVDSEHPRL
jgi:hypothetical protein